MNEAMIRLGAVGSLQGSSSAGYAFAGTIIWMPIATVLQLNITVMNWGRSGVPRSFSWVTGTDTFRQAPYASSTGR